MNIGDAEMQLAFDMEARHIIMDSHHERARGGNDGLGDLAVEGLLGSPDRENYETLAQEIVANNTSQSRAVVALRNMYSSEDEANETAAASMRESRRRLMELNMEERGIIKRQRRRARRLRRARDILPTIYSSDEDDLDTDASDEDDDEDNEMALNRPTMSAILKEKRRLNRETRRKKCAICYLMCYAHLNKSDVFAPIIACCDTLMTNATEKAGIGERVRSTTNKLNDVVQELKNDMFITMLTDYDVRYHYNIEPFDGKGCIVNEEMAIDKSIQQLELLKARINQTCYTVESDTRRKGVDVNNSKLLAHTAAVQTKLIKDKLAVRLLKKKLRDLESKNESASVLLTTDKSQKALLGAGEEYNDFIVDSAGGDATAHNSVYRTDNNGL